MIGHDIIVFGASAGGVEALREALRGMPAPIDAALFAVLHLPSGARSNLPEILTRSGPFRSEHPVDHQPFERSVVYVGPPDHHLMIEERRMRVVRGPRHNRHRPAVDPLFQSAARTYGGRVIGVILSGTLDDGTLGMVTIQKHGGLTVVQDPKTSLYPGMPHSVMREIRVNHSLPAEAIGPLLGRLVDSPAGSSPASDPNLDIQFHRFLGERSDMDKTNGKPAVYACPECHGSLWEFDDNNVLQFRCRVGHSFSGENLLAEHDSSVESSLWAGLRALEENASLRRRLAARMRHAKQLRLADLYLAKAEESEAYAGKIRELLTAPDSVQVADSNVEG